MTERVWDRSLLITSIVVAMIASASLWLAWSASPGAVARFSLAAFAPAFGAAVVSYALRTARFYYFLTRSGIRISFRETIRIQLIGFALSVTPGRVGEVFKLRLIRRDAGTPVVQSAPLLLLDRLTEGGGFLILAITSALVLPTFEDDVPISAFLLVGLGVMLVLALTRKQWSRIFEFVRLRLGKSNWGERLAPHLENLGRGMQSTFTARQIAGGLALSVLARFADGLAVYFMARMVNVNLGLAPSVFVLATSGLVGGASFLPAGIGAVEATMTGLLMLFNVRLSRAVAVTLFTRLVTLWMWVALGLVVAFLSRLSPLDKPRIEPEL
jgi:uncharacterized protein (TIRG00374 family)